MAKGAVSEQRVLITTFLVDLLDVVINLVVAIMTGSVVLLAEFFQGLADLTAAGLLLIGHKRSKKRADKRHPFGYGKEVYFWTLISAVVMMTFTATASFYFGLMRFLDPEEIDRLWLGYLTLGITLATNLYAFTLSSSRLKKSKSFMQLPKLFHGSDDVTVKNALVLDLMGTTAAVSGLISLLLYQFAGEKRFDGIGAMFIGISTCVLAVVLVTSLRGLLVGERAAPEVEEKITKAALDIHEVKDVLDLRTMQIGLDKLLVNIEVHIEDGLSTDEIEKLTDKIKERLLEKVPSVKYVQVELETP